MKHVLIIGGGLAGCTVAKELSANGIFATVVELSGRIGGRVREYGCKATDVCNNCGVCLSAGLWEKTESSDQISILTGARLIDLSGKKGRFTAAIKNKGGVKYLKGVSDVVVATGFEPATLEGFNGFAELNGTRRLITGSALEKICKERKAKSLFEKPPASLAFIQCYGSRDNKENSLYCSKVCCAYSTRAAKVIKHYYRECKIVFFYMELQMVKGGDYFRELCDLGMDFIKCRPVAIDGSEGKVTYDDPKTGKREAQKFDIVVLSDGIHPAAGADRMAEICGLSQDSTGFVRYTNGFSDARKTGVFLAGCAGGPKKIEETYNEAVSVAREIISEGGLE